MPFPGLCRRADADGQKAAPAQNRSVTARSEHPQLLLKHTAPPRHRNDKQLLSLFLKRYKTSGVPGRLHGGEAQPLQGVSILQMPRRGTDVIGAKIISFFQLLGLAAWQSVS